MYTYSYGCNTENYLRLIGQHECLENNEHQVEIVRIYDCDLTITFTGSVFSVYSQGNIDEVSHSKHCRRSRQNIFVVHQGEV